MDDNEPLTPATDMPETADGVNEPADVRVERILEYVDDSLKEKMPCKRRSAPLAATSCSCSIACVRRLTKRSKRRPIP